MPKILFSKMVLTLRALELRPAKCNGVYLWLFKSLTFALFAINTSSGPFEEQIAA